MVASMMTCTCTGILLVLLHTTAKSELISPFTTNVRKYRPSISLGSPDMLKQLDFRGGSSGSDEELDAYVEQLIAGVSDDDGSTSTKRVPDNNFGVKSAHDTNIQPPVKRKRRQRKRKKTSTEAKVEMNEEAIIESESANVEPVKKTEASTIPTNAQDATIQVSTKEKRRKRKRKKISTKVHGEVNEEAVIESESSSVQPLKKSKTSTIPTDENVQEEQVEIKNLEEDSPRIEESNEQVKQTEPRTHNVDNTPSRATTTRGLHTPRSASPPNALQRILLSQGFIGRVLAAFTLLISEMFHRYLPDLYAVVNIFLPAETSRNQGPRKTKTQKGVHSQYAAFASGQSVGGKKISKDQKKQMDRVALDKLKHVKGGVKSGKYAHLSTTFMKKYNLGKYADEAKVFESIIAPLEYEVDGDKSENHDETEEDSEDWVMKALSGEGISEVDTFFNEKASSVDTDYTSTGLDLDIGEKAPSKARKDVKVKNGDKDSGFMGRIRAVGANSGVSTRILGAYPGDAFPIGEAASAFGVTELAERYGFGDWSDDEGSSSEEVDWDARPPEFDGGAGKHRRKKQRKSVHGDGRATGKQRRKKRRKTSPAVSQGISFSFEVKQSASSSLPKSRRPQHRPRRSSSPARENSGNSPLRRSSTIEARGRDRRRPERVRDELQGKLGSNSRFMKSPSEVKAPMERLTNLKKKKDEEARSLHKNNANQDRDTRIRRPLQRIVENELRNKLKRTRVRDELEKK